MEIIVKNTSFIGKEGQKNLLRLLDAIDAIATSQEKTGKKVSLMWDTVEFYGLRISKRAGSKNSARKGFVEWVIHLGKQAKNTNDFVHSPPLSEK